VWKLSDSFHRATQVATFAGQIIAFAFIGLGVFIILGGNFFNGLWLVLIGWFLQNAAAASYLHANLQQSLRDVRVTQVMRRDCAEVSERTPLGQLVEEQVLTGAQRCFFVTDNSHLRGMLTLRDIAAIPRDQWLSVTTGQAMAPWERLVKVRPDTELLAALQVMDDANVAQVPVVDGERFVGMLSREHVLHYIRARAELGM
jgi:CBS domain-containing protein